MQHRRRTCTEEQWTAGAVKSALIEAFEVLRDTTGRVGHRRVKAYWPDFPAELDDIWEQRRTGANADGRMRARIQRTARQISRMEAVLLGSISPTGAEVPAWLNGAIKGYPDLLGLLLEWIFAQLRGESAADLCRGMGWPYSSFKRNRDRAAQMIADGLNRSGTSVW